MAFEKARGTAETAPGGPARRNTALGLILDAVIFRHTLFSLPFAVMAVLLETGGRPPLFKAALILIAAVSGRNAANALNRVIDAGIDARNPRTRDRHIPRGLLSKKSLLLTALGFIIVLVVAAALLNPLCVLLLPLAGILIGGYSYSKRFTWLCHYWLGTACACSVMGSFIGLSGHFALRYFVLSGTHALWVAGFDILYALPDIEFDRKEGLYSIPCCFGAPLARAFAFASHLGTIAGLFLVPFFWKLSVYYWPAAVCAALLLVTEHLIALGKTERHIRLASYSINEILPLILLAGIAAGIYIE
ncbi:MAG: putative 4-hydroxybenzoate polyprenyltransferase [Spirochaetaceae bacterium]|jgi:4-hydroxybenzoate polyprenyltransferase|nr:putative 4-hydroxybenzoate polyprenyltransferase [Spirochaetaceae bacterium]